MENVQLKNRFSFTVFGQMARNSVRISRIIWNENKISVMVLALAFLFVSATPFIQSGASAILINGLVTSGIGAINTSQVIFLVTIMILAGFVPSIFRIIQD